MIIDQGAIPGTKRRYPRVPPDLSNNGYQITFMDEKGNWQGSVSLVKELPKDKCQVVVHAHEYTINKMKLDPNYSWIEDIEATDPRFYNN